MRNRYRSVGWLLLPVCATVVTGLRLAAMQEERDRLERTRAAGFSLGMPPGAPRAASGQPPRPPSHLHPQPVWIKRVGQLQLVKWGDPSGIEHETVIIRDRHGRTVARISGHWVHLEMVQDLTGDGIPVLVVRVWTGCGHDASVYYVYSAGQRPRCLLAYNKRAADDEPDSTSDFQSKDLNGDGQKEFISWYDGFSYGIPNTDWASSYGGSARVPVVLGFRRGRYVDVTLDYRARLEQGLAQTRERFLEVLNEVRDAELTGSRSQGMVQYYALAVLLHGPLAARRMVCDLLPAQYHSVFLQNCWRIDRVLADRWKRYAYPPAYRSEQAFASDALPPPDNAAPTDSEPSSGKRENRQAIAR